MNSLENPLNAIIVGGGYFGCSIAYHLCKQRVKTALYDKAEITSGASGCNFGCVQVQDASDGLSLELTLKGFERMQSMSAELNTDIGFDFAGSLLGAEKECHLEELHRLYETKKAAGLDIKWVDGKDIGQYERCFKPGAVLAATYFRQGRIYPYSYMYALIKQAKAAGLLVHEHNPVKSLYMVGGKCRGIILDSGETVKADCVIIAAGGGTKELCKTAGLYAPVHAVKSEAFVTEQIKPLINNFYSSAGFFAEAHNAEAASTSLCFTQGIHGNLLIGETSKPNAIVSGGMRDLTSGEHLSNVAAFVEQMIPSVMGLNILRSWVTQSPYTDSCLPVFGESCVDGLIIAAGFKSAAVMSPVVGDIVSRIVTGGTPRYNLAEFIGQASQCAG